MRKKIILSVLITFMALFFMPQVYALEPQARFELAKVGCIVGAEPAVCGNGVKEGAELCDGADFGGLTCVNFGYDWGNLACNSDCEIDTTGCFMYECGNSWVEPGEECDGGFWAPSAPTCAATETRTCNSDCEVECVPSAVCGNGTLDAGEPCDGDEFDFAARQAAEDALRARLDADCVAYDDYAMNISCDINCEIQADGECCNHIHINEDCAGTQECSRSAFSKDTCDLITDAYGVCAWDDTAGQCTGYFSCNVFEDGTEKSCEDSVFLGTYWGICIDKPWEYDFYLHPFCFYQEEREACGNKLSPAEMTVGLNPYPEGWTEYQYPDGMCSGMSSVFGFGFATGNYCPDGEYLLQDYDFKGEKGDFFFDMNNASCNAGTDDFGREAHVCKYDVTIYKILKFY